LEAEKNKNTILEGNLNELKKNEEETEMRNEIRKEIQVLQNEKANLKNELKNYESNDPQQFDKLKARTIESKKACNRWIENIFSLKSWLKKKFQTTESVIDGQFEIPEDLDYIP
jgi:hypothetical protein